MNQQEREMLAAYGEAMLYAHLIEDLLRLHLHKCSFFKVNGYCEPHSKIKAMDFENMVNKIGEVYKDSERFVTDMHHIRKIRNHLTHAFVDQVGLDLRTESGRDQIHAMLNRIVFHEHRQLKALQKTHDTVLREGMKRDFVKVLQTEEPDFDASIAKSKIISLLHGLDEPQR